MNPQPVPAEFKSPEHAREYGVPEDDIARMFPANRHERRKAKKQPRHGAERV